MVRDLFRIVGAACILSGIILYFTPGVQSDSTLAEQNQTLNEEIDKLQTKLQKTEEELAHLQTISTEDRAPVEEKHEETEEDKHLRLKIETGTSSKDVADELEKAGIVEDAEVFNDFLTNNQFAKNIQIGEYEIDETMTQEQIAELITTLVE